ncbi:MAG: hypothetical protein QM535_19285 [Limnohabitans sp.]|nr:hypothetical protein [Limnohabitans sp.]
MRTIIIYCKKCNKRITDELVEIDKSEITFPDFTDAIPEGRFTIFKERDILSLLVNKNQPLLKDHTDSHRFTGCCGSSGIYGMNKVCANTHEVATEISDCCTSHYLSVSLKNTIVKIVNEDGSIQQADYKFYAIK